jgi:hypothetical protein
VVQLIVAPEEVTLLLLTFERVGGVVSPPPPPPPLTVTEPLDPEHDTGLAEASEARIPVIPTARVPEDPPAILSVTAAKLDGMAVVPP